MGNDEPVDCGVFDVLANSGMALKLIEAGGMDEEDSYWVPISQICGESDLNADSEEGDEGTLFLPEWLAIEKGFA